MLTLVLQKERKNKSMNEEYANWMVWKKLKEREVNRKELKERYKTG